MQFLANTHIDFMKYRKFFVAVSIALLLVCMAELFALGGLNLGIDFAGGTQMAVRLREAPDVDALRGALESSGLSGLSMQRYGDVGDNEVLIKVPVVEGSEEGSSSEILAALGQALNSASAGKFDLNTNGSDALGAFLLERDPDGLRTSSNSDDPQDEARESYLSLSRRVLEKRNEIGIFSDWNEVAVEGLGEQAMTLLQADASLGGFAVLSNENVGPQIGSELRNKGILAMVFSLIGMLAYIWYRFELRFGVGAIVAVFHDFLIVLGLYALLDYEFNLPTIAAFLTLIGYSVNDTVVIFDRVRENMRRHRRQPLIDTMNMSLNQTLSRTVLTSGTTLLVVGTLFFFGGQAIHGFAFVLLIGIFVGTYSSIFVASPFALLWEQWFGQDAQQKKARRAA
jgi:preprotein translocase subunit SecF